MNTETATEKFCRLLRACAVEMQIVSPEELEWLLTREAPDSPFSGYLAELGHAYGLGFEACLSSELDWEKVKSEIPQILSDLREKTNLFIQVRHETRLIPLLDTSSFREWLAAWNSRRLERFLCFFADQTLLQTPFLSAPICGKNNLRTHISRQFHNSDMTLSLDHVLWDTSNEYVVVWIMSGSRCFGLQLEKSQFPVSIQGEWNLTIKPAASFGRGFRGRVLKCVETWNVEEVSLLFHTTERLEKRNERSGLEVTETEIRFPSGFRVPRNISVPRK